MTNKPIILVLAGLPGVGKSAVIQVLKELGFTTKSGSDDYIQPTFVQKYNEHKRKGSTEYGDFPFFLSMTNEPPFPELQPHEWRQLDYNLKSELRPHLTYHALKIREQDPEHVAKAVLDLVDSYPAAVDSARTTGDYSGFFDGPHQDAKTYLLEIVADESVRVARVGESALSKSFHETERQMVKMLEVYREKLAQDGRYLRLENNFENLEDLREAVCLLLSKVGLPPITPIVV